MREHATPEEQRERRAPRPAAAPPHPILNLQRMAGNRAVTGMLTRQPQQAEPADAPAKGSGYTLDMGELGTIPVIALNWEPRQSEVVISSPTGDYVPRLMQASTQGRPFPVVVLTSGAVRTTMKEVLISSVQTGSGEVVTFTLNFKDIEHEYPGSG